MNNEKELKKIHNNTPLADGTLPLNKTVVIILAATSIFYLPAIALLVYIIIRKKGAAFKKWYTFVTIAWLLFPLISLALNPSYSATTSYELQNYEDVKVEGSYEADVVPAKPAQYSEPEVVTYTMVSEDLFGGTSLVCGEDLQADTEYTISTDEQSGTLIMDLQEVGTGYATFDGESLHDGQKFECKAGYEVDLYNDKGTITFTSEKEEIAPATDEIPAKTHDTTLTQSYDQTTGEKTAVTCKDDSKEVDCETLPNYEEMLALVDETAKETQTTETITETVTYDGYTESWVYEVNDVEVSDKNELKELEKLEAEVNSEMSK